MANQNLNGRVAIVTGGSRGIDREIAIHLHSLGARVIINYASSSKQAEELASQLNTNSSELSAIAVKADVSDPDEVKLLFDKAEQEMGQVHVLVNSAGVLDPKYPSLADTTVDDWDKTFSINTKGAFLVCREAANRLARGGARRIIMITTSAVGGLMPGYAAYAASKAAVETITKIVAKELKGTGITANCVAPGPVATELFFAGKSEETMNKMKDACPLGRLGQPQDVSPVVGFLAGDAGQWINGQVLRVNGGSVIKPSKDGVETHKKSVSECI
ncbi:NADPH-dependent aldehyde reductase-like protein, chloroplastic [Argentina anserina]|uniref:NADPH-dependent aldehyde reductase-like protein, chloroplastic n=1 Tax=Argentina anserina TaxID=57926 RepID=UPI0021765981|nr:NADPH-dependent aldehyde reductase-like protein, chloroplastic [Potentilla anserina]